MKFILLLALLSMLILSCEPTRKVSPPLPPGMERGMKWEKAVDYEYEEDIYITPDYIAYAIKGTRALLFGLRETYNESVCENGPARLTIQYVVSKNGQILWIHPMQEINPGCKERLTQKLERFEFFPAEYKDQKVNMLMAVTISDRRI